MIKFADGKTIKYTYSADGRKLRAVYTTVRPATSKQVDYCGNLIFENGQLKQMLVDGGYIPMDDWSGTYRFYVKDHIGNNRMVMHEYYGAEQMNNYYPYGGLMSSSTGWNVQRFKYNGKELDLMHGLNTYDYGARQHDPILARWDRIDPLCEKYYNVSPYAYCANNPVIIVDPDGRDGKVAINGSRITVSANIYLYGPDATKSVQQKIQGVIDRVWGGQHKYSHQGKNFSVQINANVQLYDDMEKQNPMFIADSWNPFSRNNYIKVDNKIARSRVSGGDEGIWDGNGYVGGLGIEFENYIAHEFGHLLGLPDQYSPTPINGETRDIINDGWEDNIMGNCDFGKVEQRNINDIMNEVMKAYDEWTKAGNTGIFHYDINP